MILESGKKKGPYCNRVLPSFINVLLGFENLAPVFLLPY